MANQTDGSVAPLCDKRWLWVTRAMVGLPAAVMAGFIILESIRTAHGRPDGVGIFFVGLLVGPLFLIILPFAIGAFHLMRNTPQSLKKGLAWAVVVGSFWAIFLPVYTLSSDTTEDAALTAAMATLTLASSALAFSAIKTYYTVQREKGDGRILAKRVPLFLVTLYLVAAQVLPGRLTSRQAKHQVVAVASLRTINTSEMTYSSTYNQGFSSSLAALGEKSGAPATPEAARLIDPQLASGEKGRYHFVYAPGPRNGKGEIDSYTLTASPVDGPGKGNFYFTDQTGVIRMNSEGPATARDEPVKGPLWLMQLAIVFSCLAFGRIVSDTSWDVSPRKFIVTAIVAACFWVAFFVRLFQGRRAGL